MELSDFEVQKVQKSETFELSYLCKYAHPFFWYQTALTSEYPNTFWSEFQIKLQAISVLQATTNTLGNTNNYKALPDFC